MAKRAKPATDFVEWDARASVDRPMPSMDGLDAMEVRLVLGCPYPTIV